MRRSRDSQGSQRSSKRRRPLSDVVRFFDTEDEDETFLGNGNSANNERDRGYTQSVSFFGHQAAESDTSAADEDAFEFTSQPRYGNSRIGSSFVNQSNNYSSHLPSHLSSSSSHPSRLSIRQDSPWIDSPLTDSDVDVEDEHIERIPLKIQQSISMLQSVRFVFERESGKLEHGEAIEETSTISQMVHHLSTTQRIVRSNQDFLTRITNSINVARSRLAQEQDKAEMINQYEEERHNWIQARYSIKQACRRAAQDHDANQYRELKKQLVDCQWTGIEKPLSNRTPLQKASIELLDPMNQLLESFKQHKQQSKQESSEAKKAARRQELRQRKVDSINRQANAGVLDQSGRPLDNVANNSVDSSTHRSLTAMQTYSNTMNRIIDANQLTSNHFNQFLQEQFALSRVKLLTHLNQLNLIDLNALETTAICSDLISHVITPLNRFPTTCSSVPSSQSSRSFNASPQSSSNNQSFNDEYEPPTAHSSISSSLNNHFANHTPHYRSFVSADPQTTMVEDQVQYEAQELEYLIGLSTDPYYQSPSDDDNDPFHLD